MRNGPVWLRAGAAMFTLTALSALVIAGCSSKGSSKSKGSQGTPAAATPTAAAPLAQPTINGSSFVFPDRGYAATIPDGWHANPNSLLAGPQQIDAFFSDDTVDGVQSNISVTCEANTTKLTTDEYVQARLKTVQALGAADLKTLPAQTVAGTTAQVVSYSLKRQNTTIDKVDVMFVSPKCAWTVASASAPSAATQVSAKLTTFLQSFKLVDKKPPA